MALRRSETGTSEGGQAVSVTTTWLPPTVADKAPRLADSQPLPAGALACIAEAAATRADEDNTAAPEDADTAKALGIPPSSPVLITRTRHDTAGGQAIAYTETITAAGHRHTRTYTITGN